MTFARLWTLILIGLAFNAHAALTTLDSAEAMNLSGMQRMLSQRIAKSYLMLGQDVRPDVAREQLEQSIATFESNQRALLAYAPTEEIRSELGVTQSLWQPYRQLALTAPDRQQALEVLAQSERLLGQCEHVVRLIETQAGKPTAQLVNRSGRQRMLSQRIAKLYLAMSWHLPIQGLDTQFRQAVTDFDGALRELQSARQNTAAISASLDKADAQWSYMRAGFELSADARYVPTVITLSTDSLLRQMNDLTLSYESVMQQ